MKGSRSTRPHSLTGSGGKKFSSDPLVAELELALETARHRESLECKHVARIERQLVREITRSRSNSPIRGPSAASGRTRPATAMDERRFDALERKVLDLENRVINARSSDISSIRNKALDADSFGVDKLLAMTKRCEELEALLVQARVEGNHTSSGNESKIAELEKQPTLESKIGDFFSHSHLPKAPSKNSRTTGFHVSASHPSCVKSGHSACFH